MTMVLLLTDYTNTKKIATITRALESDKCTVATINVADMTGLKETLEGRWKIIVIWVDSHRKSHTLAYAIRKSDRKLKREKTPIVFHQLPSAFRTANLTIAYSHKQIAKSVQDALKILGDAAKKK